MNTSSNTRTKPTQNTPLIPEIRPEQSIELLKELHILTREGKLNQDTRRKLKQVYHLYQFIEPLLKQVAQTKTNFHLVDHGAGKSYLGFILYDLFLKAQEELAGAWVYGIETREKLVSQSEALAARLGFTRMRFLHLSVEESMHATSIPAEVDIVTALHACDTATDDAIRFGLHKQAKFMVLVPCCQAEVAAVLRKHKNRALSETPLSEMWRHPIHSRELGSHLTNVLRCLLLEAHGYKLTVTELVGWEHSMKNELIIAERTNTPRKNARDRLEAILREFRLEDLAGRFAY